MDASHRERKQSWRRVNWQGRRRRERAPNVFFDPSHRYPSELVIHLGDLNLLEPPKIDSEVAVAASIPSLSGGAGGAGWLGLPPRSPAEFPLEVPQEILLKRRENISGIKDERRTFLHVVVAIMSVEYDTLLNSPPGETKKSILMNWVRQLGIESDDPTGKRTELATAKLVADWMKAYKAANDPDFGSHVLKHKDGSPKTVREHLTEICDVYYEVYEVMVRHHGDCLAMNDPKSDTDGQYRDTKASLAMQNQAISQNRGNFNRRVVSADALANTSSTSYRRVSGRKRIEVEIISSDNEDTSDNPQKRIIRQEPDTIAVYTAEAKLFQAGGMTDTHRRFLSRQKEEDREIEREKLRLQRSELEFKREELEVRKLEARAKLLENGAA
ncbi:hypothetical protein K440DRAFT_640167 [Wilcoxina mikolae CBS 423.85]|nr:hypothetical protein K440DRAFT_640167 [Wilcoxina mikolae CBS 423.85]